MLLIADRDRTGIVDMPVERLAAKAGLTVEQTREGLAILSSPDDESRSDEEEGRRIVPIKEGSSRGWILVNWQKYKEISKEEHQREATRQRVAKHREGNGPQAGGYVYYASPKDSDRVKIGYSKNPWARVCELRVAIPSLEVIATERGDVALEKMRHAQFSKARIEGEWFSRTPEIVAHIAFVVTVGNASVTRSNPVGNAPSEYESVVEPVVGFDSKGGLSRGDSKKALQLTDFERLWALYPRRIGKADAKRHFLAQVKYPTEVPLLESAIRNYIKEIAALSVGDTFIKHASSFFNQRWRDYIDGVWVCPNPGTKSTSMNAITGQPGHNPPPEPAPTRTESLATLISEFAPRVTTIIEMFGDPEAGGEAERDFCDQAWFIDGPSGDRWKRWKQLTEDTML